MLVAIIRSVFDFLISEGGCLDSPGWPWIYYAVKAGLKPLIFLPAHPKCSMHLNGRQAGAGTICFLEQRHPLSPAPISTAIVLSCTRHPFQVSSLAFRQLSRSSVCRLSHPRLSQPSLLVPCFWRAPTHTSSLKRYREVRASFPIFAP